MLGLVIASFVLVFALVARASWKVGRLLRQLKAQEYALWSELSIWQSWSEIVERDCRNRLGEPDYCDPASTTLRRRMCSIEVTVPTATGSFASAT